jgi:hypothetical protein
MIFFGGVGSMLFLANQLLATQKTSKNGKNAKKSAKYFLPDPRFAAKTPQKRPVFSVSTKLSRGL